MKVINTHKDLEGYLTENQKVTLEYEGVFDKQKIVELGSFIKEKTKKYPQAEKKLFYIFVELAQNVGYYSDEREIFEGKDTGKGKVVFFETENTLGFIIGNVIRNSALKVLLKKCELINSMDREELREFKRRQRNLIPGTNGQAHIGLIMVSLMTKQPLQIFSAEIDETYSFFSIKVEVEKN